MGEEEIELISDAEIDVYISENHEADFMRELKKIPKITAEENLELTRKYAESQEGSKEQICLQNELVERNLRLIVSIAYRKMRKATSFKLLDLVNEGTLGFIKGLQKFDPSLGYKLSTYVCNWIEQSIDRALENKDKQVRRSTHWEQLINKYNKLVASYNISGKPLPSIQVLADILNTTEDTIKEIQRDYRLNPTSLDINIDDDEKTDLSNFVGQNEQGYDEILDNITYREYLIVLKNNLSKRGYFVFYYRNLVDEPRELRYFVSKLGISHERIRQIEARARKKAKLIFSNEGLLRRELTRIKNERIPAKEELSPIDPGAVPFFYFIKDKLYSKERELYELLLFAFDDKKDEDFAREMGISLQEYKRVYAGLIKKVNRFREVQYLPIYFAFKRVFIQEYGFDILDLDLEIPTDLYEKKSLSNRENLILTDLREFDIKIEDVYRIGDANSRKLVNVAVNRVLEDIGDSLSLQIKNLIRRYFSFIQDPIITKVEAEREVNAIAHGYKDNASLPRGVLYETALKNRDKFSQEQFDCLMCYMFGKMKKKDFKLKYPNSIMKNELSYLSLRLEKLYFVLSNSYTYNFTKEKYISLREMCLENNLTPQVEVLDQLFGFGGSSPHSIDEIAKMREIDYLKAHKLVRTAREKCLSCWLKHHDDKEVYLPYLLNDEYSINERGRKFAIEHFCEGKSCKEIGTPFNLSVRQVSNIVNDCLRQIDFYRFGITSSVNIYTSIVREAVLKSKRFNDEQKNIIRTTLKIRSYKKVGEILGIEVIKIKRTMSKFYDACYKYSVESVHVSHKMVEEEIKRHKRDTVLGDEEILVLAHLYGVKCEQNPDGEILSSGEIQAKYRFSIDKVSKLKTGGLRSIAAKTLGLEIPPLAPIERDKLYKLLKDPYLPIAAREKEILSYYFEFDGYPIKNIEELAQMYKLSDDSVRRVIKRAYVSIFKYDLGEIDGVMSYEEHVLPNLKYFPKSDQAILTDYYKDNLSQTQIGLRRGSTREQVYNRLFKLKIQLKDILEGNTVGFDYDYFEDHVLDSDIPFYGDKELTYKMWWMFYEEKMSKEKIIKELGLDTGITKLQKDLDMLMCAVLKRKMGIKKSREFSYEEIRDYYLAHVSEMELQHKMYYYRYFNRKKKWGDAHASRTTSDVSLVITCDLLKDKGEHYISLDKMTKEQALDFIRKNRSKMSKGCLNFLSFHFKLQGKDFMSGSDKNKVMRAMAQLRLDGKVLHMDRNQQK